jgi:hypothetical protein
MENREKLLSSAQASPGSLSFDQLCALAESYGFIFKRQRGTSHRIYGHPSLDPSQGGFMNFQSDKGKAKAYQVRQLLKAIENLKKHDDE